MFLFFDTRFYAFFGAAKVLQALYFVPQVRESVAKLRLPHIDENLPDPLGK